MRIVGAALAAVLVLLATAACGGGDPGRSPSPTPSSTVPVDSAAAFTAFAGVPIPAQARDVEVRTDVDTSGQPEYHVRFSLPSDQLDAFAADAQLDRPLRVQTIPADYRTTFDYTGDSASGVALTEAGLPSDQRVQRKLLAIGTKTATADVRVFANRIPA